MVKASITLDGIAALKPEQIRAAGRKALRVIGRHWITAFLPIHFTNAAYSRYGYTARKPSYDYRKRRRMNNGQSTAIGEVKPLVWSGQSRESSKLARFMLENSGSTTSAAGSVVINAPALNFKNANSNIDMQAEVTRVTQAEINELAAIFVAEFDRELGRLGRTTKRRIAA